MRAELKYSIDTIFRNTKRYQYETNNFINALRDAV